MAKLNSQQLNAVTILDRPLLVLAGAGSGKTRVITEKIAYLIAQGIPAKNIVAVTFTNKAASEMKQRVAKLLSGKASSGLRVSTFHALGLEILRQEHTSLSYKANLTLFDDQDTLTLLRSLCYHSAQRYDVEQVERYAAAISRWKNAFILPEQALIQANSATYPLALLYRDYSRNLKAYNAVDFDDLLLLPVQLLQQQPEILQKWQHKIRYLLVDEYQDTNLTQYQLVKLLAGKLGKFTVVGDDDQSIYAWRGAQPENLLQLQQDYPRLAVIKLEQNYRSTGRILKVANHLIANNPHTFEKRLWSNLGYGDPLRVLSHKDEAFEAQQIVAEIVHHKLRTNSRYEDYAILYRGNHQARLFERSLREHSIPYFISGSTSFFAYTEIKDILAYLRLLVNSADDAAFLRIINTPRREIGPTTLEKLGTYANARHISLFAACFEFGLKQHIGERAQYRLEKFCQWINHTAHALQQGDTFSVLEHCIQELGYEQWLRENTKTEASAERKLRNVYDLLAWLKRLATPQDGSPTLSLADVVAKMMLMDILQRHDAQEATDQVSLMTLHAAKGLEFPHVYLIGMEENLLPHENSIETDSIEEERRLAYVGITRAQRSLTFSYCTHRRRYGELNECKPSRFLQELPQEDLEWSAKKPLDPEETKRRGLAYIAQIKTMLS